MHRNHILRNTLDLSSRQETQRICPNLKNSSPLWHSPIGFSCENTLSRAFLRVEGSSATPLETYAKAFPLWIGKHKKIGKEFDPLQHMSHTSPSPLAFSLWPAGKDHRRVLTLWPNQHGMLRQIDNDSRVVCNIWTTDDTSVISVLVRGKWPLKYGHSVRTKKSPSFQSFHVRASLRGGPSRSPKKDRWVPTSQRNRPVTFRNCSTLL